MKKKIVSLFLLLLSVFVSNAQETGEDEFGAWYMYFGTFKVADKLSIHTEAQFRFYEIASNFNQLLLRTGLNYHLSDNAIVTLGYGFIDTDPTFTDDQLLGAPFLENNIDEHRIFQQFILKNTVGKFKFEHRYRLEQRFISTSLDNFTDHRARYRLQLTYPINDRWFLNAYDELFINLQEPIFGQNRLYGAVGYNFSKEISVQFGYLKNHFTGSNFDRLQLALFINTDLRKKKTENN
ncbi:DUF2490 domain-containing protein [Leptobacterium flavescens]|uniref:DUF2490 domain-containing protein n=1 Tax=Leptobacterium flavescens TaxID=472055 RepID=A0A6P0ULJ7_9FLAO|nr:DUF2490 domain-containing protein [Leptobacterium flavescens]NER14125.1 DUF2490 domain-containing protein [Leptobacterium flavescens]